MVDKIDKAGVNWVGNEEIESNAESGGGGRKGPVNLTTEKNVVERSHFQHIFSLNVWADVVNGTFTEPHFFPSWVTGEI